jgi:hypothetical protein
MTTIVPVVSYVAGFNYHINNLVVDMSVIPFTVGDKLYETIRYKGIYEMALVRFNLTFDGKTVSIFIPFYLSSGTNSSKVGAGTWFPFHCASQKGETGPREYYFRSNYGTSYLFKMGHYFIEPFSGRCNDIRRDIGPRDIIESPPASTCSRQRNFLIEQTSEIPLEILYPEIDKGIGVHTILQRFGNLLYLTASYFLFGDPNSWNPSNYKDGSQERAFAQVLTRISSEARFGTQLWRQILDRLPRTNFNPASYYAANSSNILNSILAVNNVPMPHYQDVLRIDNSPDAKFITSMKLLQIVGELYLDSQSTLLWDRFKSTFNRAYSINNISLTDQNNLNIGNDFYVWLVPEIFTGTNTLVRLYRFT